MENFGPNLYVVDATMPPDTSKAQYRLMLQQLLKERFHLEVHREKRNFPGYELVAAEGGPKLKESKPDPNVPVEEPNVNAAGKLVLTKGPQMITSLGWGFITVQVQQKPIGDVAKEMGWMINKSLGENANDYASPKARVLDRTGLNSTYDFTLRFSCELCQFAVANGAVMPATPPPADSPGGEPSIFRAVQKQLGLKLNKVKDIPLDLIVVDRVENMPAEN
jgi:uncharacterized protein (TIGR03435 family)